MFVHRHCECQTRAMGLHRLVPSSVSSRSKALALMLVARTARNRFIVLSCLCVSCATVTFISFILSSARLCFERHVRCCCGHPAFTGSSACTSPTYMVECRVAISGIIIMIWESIPDSSTQNPLCMNLVLRVGFLSPPRTSSYVMTDLLRRAAAELARCGVPNRHLYETTRRFRVI